jgi:hypothetical protein
MLYNQQDTLDEAQQQYDELVQSTSAQIAQLTRNYKSRLEKVVRQAEAQASVATKRLQAITSARASADFRNHDSGVV